ncbi:MAG: hypothetical protein U1A78_07295 [Polyangia bacterium]
MPTVDRLSKGPLTLLAQALGPPAAWPGKARRLVELIGRYRRYGRYGRGDLVDARLRILHEQGEIERIPTRVQLAVGALDMLRFFISPAAADYYRQQGIRYEFHQLLRFLDEPASLGDPLGLLSTRDGIIGHLMQVVHANPVYDLQLLRMFPDGIAELERQLMAMLAGTHPRQRSIGAIVEEPDYHGRLLAHVRAHGSDPAAPPLLRKNLLVGSELARLERVFGSLTAAMRYFTRLPTGPAAALAHLVTVRSFPWRLVGETDAR